MAHSMAHVSLRLKIADLSSTPRTLSASLPTSWCAERMDGVYRVLQPQMPVQVIASRTAEVVEVTVHADGRFGFDCSRCAEPAELTLDVDFTHHFVGPGQLDAGDPDDMETELAADPDVSEHDGVNVDLEPLCIENAILALPFVPLCSDECRGLCPHCGTNLNQSTCQCSRDADARTPWTVLKEIKIQPKA